MSCDDLNLGILEFGYTKRDGRLRSGLEFTMTLAQMADEWGYSRFWFTEHHSPDLEIACPEVVIAAVAAQTRRIRVGSAGILLRYYSPFKVAEVFHTLSTMFPDRIDLGLARGIGAGPRAAELLHEGRSEPEDIGGYEALFERKTKELIAHLRSGYASQRDYDSEAPLPSLPEIWLMGSGAGSAALAATLGAKLTMALWYAKPGSVDIKAILALYAERFQPAPDGPPATGCISLAGICAETEGEAETLLAKARERYPDAITNFCGSPEHCRETIRGLAATHGVHDVIVVPQCREAEQKLHMFRLLGDVMLSTKRAPRHAIARSQAA